MDKLRPASLLHLLALVAFSTLSPAKEEWRFFESPHYEVVTEAGPAREAVTRRILVKLEQTRTLAGEVFSGLPLDPAQPVIVMIFRDERSMRPYLAGSRPVSGYSLRTDDRHYIVLPSSAESEAQSNTDRKAVHEQLRLILGLKYPVIPLWVSEGSAELFLGAEIRAGQATLGLPPAAYLATLREKKPIPLEQFLDLAEDSKDLLEPANASLYRAEAWAMVHYLITLGMGDRSASARSGRGANALSTFLELLGEGVDQPTALQQVTAVDLENLGKAAFQPRRSPEDYARRRLAWKTVFAERQIRARVLSEAEALAYQGDLLLHLGRYDAARIKLDAALALEPNLAVAQVARALLAVQLSQWVDARKRLQALSHDAPGQAAAEAPASPSARLASRHLIHFYSAMAFLRQPLSLAPQLPAPVTPGERESAESELRRAIELRENFAPAFRLLAGVEMAKGNLAGAQSLAEQAAMLEPQNISNRLTLAEIQTRKGDSQGAHRTLALASASSSAAERARIAEVVEQMKARLAKMERAREQRAEDADRPRWEKSKADTPPKNLPRPKAAIPSAKQAPRSAGQAYPPELPEMQRETPEAPTAPTEPPKYAFVRGRVAEVVCQPSPERGKPAAPEAPGKPEARKKAPSETLRSKQTRPPALILSVKAKSRTFRFYREDLSQVAVIAPPGDVSICESVGRTASVNYLDKPQGGFDGEIVSFELAAKEKSPVEPATAKTAGKVPSPRTQRSVFRGTVEDVSCGRPMVFTLRGKDRSGKVRVMRFRAASTTEFFAVTTRGLPPENFDACESKGLVARATFRRAPPGDPYDGELTRVEFTWTRK